MLLYMTPRINLNEPTAVECGETTKLTGAALVEDGDFKTIRWRKE